MVLVGLPAEKQDYSDACCPAENFIELSDLIDRSSDFGGKCVGLVAWLRSENGEALYLAETPARWTLVSRSINVVSSIETSFAEEPLHKSRAKIVGRYFHNQTDDVRASRGTLKAVCAVELLDSGSAEESADGESREP